MTRRKVALAVVLAITLLAIPVAAQQRGQVDVRILVSSLLRDMRDDIQQLVAEHLPHVRVAISIEEGRLDERYDQVANGRYDVVVVANVASLQDLLLPLDSFVLRSGTANPLFESMRVEGRLYDLPISLNPEVIVFNRSLFDRHELPYPRAGWTWNEFIYAVTRIREASANGHSFVVPVTIAGNLWFDVIALSGHDPLYANDRVLGDTLAIARLMLETDPVINAPGFGSAVEFRRAEVPMQWMSFSEALRQYYFDAARSPFRLPFEWGIAPLPGFASGEGINRLSTSITVGIPFTTNRPDAAWEVAQLLAREAADLPNWQFGPSAYRTSQQDLDLWITQRLPFAPEPTREELRGLFARRHVSFNRGSSPETFALAGAMNELFERVVAGELTEAEAIAEVHASRDAILALVW